MKKGIMTVLLGLAVVGQAQSSSLPAYNPIYQQYITAAANALPNWDRVEAFAYALSYQMWKGNDAAVQASSAYACATFLKQIIATTNPKDLAGKVVEVGNYEASYPEAQKYCEQQYSEAYGRLPGVQAAPDAIAFIGTNYMLLENDRNGTVQSALEKVKSELKNNDLSSNLLIYTLAADIYFNKYPELKDKNFQRGSVDMGRGSVALNNSLQVLSKSAALITENTKKQVQDAQTGNKAAQQKTLTDLKNLYVKVTGWQAAAEQLTKQKKYQDATQLYFLMSTQDQALNFISTELKQQNNNQPIDVNGKKINANEVVSTLNKLISTSLQKANSVDSARQQAQQALAAQWKQAAKNTLKGDRLTIFNRFGIPNVLLPGDMYTGDEDIKRSMANIQKATGWKYSFSQTALGGFFCNVNVTFNGNKATSRNISASIVGSDADAYCKSNYRF